MKYRGQYLINSRKLEHFYIIKNSFSKKFKTKKYKIFLILNIFKLFFV